MNEALNRNNDQYVEPTRNEKLRIAAIMPRIWRPEKANFRRVWDMLSDHFEGAVFTLSEPGQSGTAIGSFKFISTSGSGTLGKLKRLRLQTFGVLLQAWRDKPFQVVIVYDPYASGLAGLFVSRVMRARLIVEMNGDYHEAPPEGSRWKKLVMKRIMHLVMGQADAIRVLNSSQEAYVTDHFRRPKVYKFADFTPVDLFLHNDASGGRYFLFVGYPFGLKGVDVLIKAYCKARRDFPDLGLRIMGHCPPPEDKPFRAMAEECSGVEFVPPAWIEDVVNEMRHAIALVNPARTEALGRVHIEAMASGKPVVASATNGAKEVVEPWKTGILVDIDDVDGLAKALRWIASNRSEAAAMGARGRERVRSFYTEERYRDNMAYMFRSVEGGTAPPNSTQ